MSISKLEQAEDSARIVHILFFQEANLLQIRFPECPHDLIRRELKSSGFRWVPDQEAWQRFRSKESVDEACRIAQIFVEHQRHNLNA